MPRPTAQPDFARAAADYAAHRPPFDSRLIDRLRSFGVGRAGQRVLDLGAGTGLFGAALADCGVTFVDPSPALLAHAPGPRVCAVAERLPFADHAFDAVTCAQSWHWFDRRIAPREILRALKPGGPLAIVYQTHLPLPGNLAGETERLILRHRPRWRHAGAAGINGQALIDLTAAGFARIESFTFDVDVSFSAQAWVGYVRTWSALAPTLDGPGLEALDADLAAFVAGQFPVGGTVAVPHRVFAAIGYGAG
ncbi:MAG TPA: class I SAM-dependent methyltransferase [Tepidisphaeraceae bacterium]|nr:class I SAM-dependent methyltransferase [Tepidisphaeraceae bacterium]